MLQRLVIALTVFIGLVGATVVAGYLAIFAAGTDRAARAVPADAIAYATVYLQPSTGQQMNLALLLGHVPGFADAANLDQKIHEIAARFLGQAGIDYEADVRPWIGNQLSVALRPGDRRPGDAVTDPAGRREGPGSGRVGDGGDRRRPRPDRRQGHLSGHGHHAWPTAWPGPCSRIC